MLCASASRWGEPCGKCARGGVTFANGERRSAAHVVVANGMAARDLLLDVPLVPKKGHLLISDRYPGLIRHQLLELG
jgi:D-hydroxyproline dehydrogenase subunit beta